MKRELIVVTRPAAAVRSYQDGVRSAVASETRSIDSLLRKGKATLLPIFSGPERTTRARSPRTVKMPTTESLLTFFRVEAEDERLDDLAQKLLKLDSVDGAYVRPRALPPVILEEAIRPLNRNEAPPVTPDFTQQQSYLEPAPIGIDARYAWTRPGGKGQGVRIIDIEGAWRFSHEDLLQNQGGVIGGIPSEDLLWRDHGTAVVGVLGGDENEFGITGICPEAEVRAISIFGAGQSTAKAISDAADALNPGDIILIELHAPGPRFNFEAPQGQKGYVPMEFWPDIFAAILYATSVRGVIVVEAGGNGWENLDDPLYENRPEGFPSTWTNPFNLANAQSGGILVGAGAPPPGTHGVNNGPDRSRLYFSNYGARIDVQGWGREVTTCGYGDLQGGTNEDFWYTNVFAGTSSASPIVLGAIACAQGTRMASGVALLSPSDAQNLLRTTGSAQQAGPLSPVTQRIGNRPNLRELISEANNGGVSTLPLHRYWNPELGDHYYTTDWNELGSGNNGWVFEWIQCHLAPRRGEGMVPLYRYWNAGVNDHFYTTEWLELETGQYGWTYEWIMGYVYPEEFPGTVPLYRYWNTGAGDHFYTTDWNELENGRDGWVFERIQCYVFPQPSIIQVSSSPGSNPSGGEVPDTFKACPAASASSGSPNPGPTGSFLLKDKNGVGGFNSPRSFAIIGSTAGSAVSPGASVIINVR